MYTEESGAQTVHVPFVDLKAQAELLGEEYRLVMESIVSRAAYTMGPELTAFEEEFANYCQCDFAVGVSSGTDALKLAYLAAGVGPGDEVIVPVNTFIATAEAVSHVGARPVFVDCQPGTANIDPALIEAAITDRTRAIVPVHLYGQPADMDAIRAIAGKHGVPVIEDACQAHGAEYRGRRTGGLGMAGAFSFYPGKNLGALGDGGAVVTNDADIAAELRLLRNHGQEDKYTHRVVGYCDRLHNLQAGFLSAKLPHLDAWNAARREAAGRYDALLSGVTGVGRLSTLGDVSHVHHLYVVLVNDRDRVREVLADEGIETGVHYPVPLHLTPAYASLGHAAGDFPAAEALAVRSMSLPMHPHLSSAQTKFVAEQLAAAVE
jgi:dTDP-4-amino-4,6-dideoxygalactose transaminase